MKFNIECRKKKFSLIVDDFEKTRPIVDLRKNLGVLKIGKFYFSSNGNDPLDEEKTAEELDLVDGSTIFILLEEKSKIDRPLRLDEVRDEKNYPLLVEKIFEESKPKTDFDLIVAILHTLMLEIGFKMDAENNFDLNSSRKSSTFYVVRYRHKSCDDPRARCSLAIMKTDDLITIDGVVNSISKACGKLSFHIDRYFNVQKQNSSNCFFPFENLDELSRSFKDDLGQRLLCKLLEICDLHSPTTLIALPNEIKLRIAKNLPVRTVFNLQMTCRDFYNTLIDSIFWRELFRRDFPRSVSTNGTDLNGSETNWREIYRLNYTEKYSNSKSQMKSAAFFHPGIFPMLPSAHRIVFPDPTVGPSPNFHPFPAAIYRPIPTGIFPTTVVPFPPGFHPVWLG